MGHVLLRHQLHRVDETGLRAELDDVPGRDLRHGRITFVVVGQEIATGDHPDVVAGKPLRGRNQWPHGLPDFRDNVMAYFTALNALGQRMLPAFAVALGMAPEFFTPLFSDDNHATLRMLHYAAWLARRWDDPAFPLAFPWFNTQAYWERHVLELREQFAALSESFSVDSGNR